MNRIAYVFAALLCLGIAQAQKPTPTPAATRSADGPEYRTLGEIERLDAGLDAVLAEDARMEILAEGFDFSEGPVWIGDEKGGSVLFSDVPRNTIYRWTEGQEGATVFLKPAPP